MLVRLARDDALAMEGDVSLNGVRVEAGPANGIDLLSNWS
jgi:hypothetical protein